MNEIPGFSPSTDTQELGKTRPWHKVNATTVNTVRLEADVVNTETVSAGIAVADTVNANTVNGDTINTPAIDAGTIDVNTLDAVAITAQTVAAPSITATTITAPTVDATSVNATTVAASSITDGESSLAVADLIDAVANPAPVQFPVASETTLGGVMVDGQTITVDLDGTLRVVGGGSESGGTSDHRELGYKNEPGQHTSVALTHNGERMDITLNAIQTSLTTKLEQSALTDFVTTEAMTAALSGYVAAGSLDVALADYATTSAVASALATKADAADLVEINEAVATKADSAATIGALAAKADADAVNAALADKADMDEMNALLADKADIVTVNAALNDKASLDMVNAALSEKADAATLDNALSGKADLEALISGLASKANKTELPAAATTTTAGLLSAVDKGKLDGVPSGLSSTLSSYGTRISSLESSGGGGDVSGLTTRVGTLETSMTQATNRLNALDTLYGGLGAMALVGDVALDGKQYVRKDRQWVEYAAESTGGSSGGGAILGEIRLLPFRKAELPAGWYFCNGDQFALTSVQGQVLNSLPSTMKTDWQITVSGSNIKLPNLFTGSDGYFFRAVNGSSRNPGNKQSDAIRNITGTFTLSPTYGSAVTGTTHGSSTFSGALYCTGFNKKIGAYGYNYGADTVGDLGFDASKCTPTSTEIRPINVGMTPAIYLGV